MKRVNYLGKQLDNLAPESPPRIVRGYLVEYSLAVADAVYAMRFDEILGVNNKDRFWDIPGVMVEDFMRFIEYKDEHASVRTGWLTEDKEPLLWAVYDSAHDLDIDERCLDDWERLFAAIEALRRENGIDSNISF